MIDACCHERVAGIAQRRRAGLESVVLATEKGALVAVHEGGRRVGCPLRDLDQRLLVGVEVRWSVPTNRQAGARVGPDRGRRAAGAAVAAPVWSPARH